MRDAPAVHQLVDGHEYEVQVFKYILLVNIISEKTQAMKKKPHEAQVPSIFLFVLSKSERQFVDVLFDVFNRY